MTENLHSDDSLSVRLVDSEKLSSGDTEIEIVYPDVATGLSFYTEFALTTPQTFDADKAQELLSEAGKTNLSLNLMYISTDKTMESEALYVQSALANVGITINLLPTDESTFKNKTKDPECTDYDLVLSFYTLGEEPSLYADMSSSDSRSNYSRIKDTDLDALWEDGNSTADETKRGEIYKEIQNTIRCCI